jgi:hypothetical protein
MDNLKRDLSLEAATMENVGIDPKRLKPGIN